DGHAQRLSLWATDVRTTMKLTVYGSGCAKCQQLTANAEAAARRLGLDFEVEKVTDVNAIIDAGVMRTPALAIDEEIVVEGKVPSSDELQQLLG
ncbi:thioredoxin family protein, partial [Leclercia adecarboxylata]